MRRLYPHAFINMQLRYGWAPRPYRVKCWLVLKFSDKTRKTSCISGSIRHHRLVNQTGSGFNSLSSLIQLFSNPLTAELCVTRLVSRHLLSATECDAVRRRAPHSVEHVLSYLELTRPDTQPLEYFVNCRQSDKRRWVCVCVLCVCMCLCVYRAGRQSPCGHPSAAWDVLWWRPEGEWWKKTLLDSCKSTF